MRVQQEHKITH